MKKYSKKEFPVAEACRFLEPTPTVLLTSSHQEYRGESHSVESGKNFIIPSLK